MSYESGLSMEERVTSLFQPDTLLPDQFMDTFRRKSHLEPEKKLMLAVLEDAIASYQKYVGARDGKGRALFQETEEWILEKTGDWLFSFANVCDTLGFDPDYLREGLLQWKAEKLESNSKANVYQIAATQPRRKKRAVRVGGRRSRQRMRKAASR
jgi:hypothetical protein